MCRLHFLVWPRGWDDSRLPQLGLEWFHVASLSMGSRKEQPEGAAGEHVTQEAKNEADLCDSDECQSILVWIFFFLYLLS